MKIRVIIISLFLPTLLAYAQEISEKHVRTAFANTLPQAWEVMNFEAMASDNYGTKVEPLWAHRFEATAVLSSDLYEEGKTVDGTMLLTKVKRTGERQQLFGVSLSRLFKGQWKTEFKMDEQLATKGKPINAYPPNSIVIGTPEEKEFFAERERKAKAKEDEIFKRFEIVEKDTVRDKKTGLTWTWHEINRLKWEESKKHCVELHHAGRSNWRMPNHRDAMSLQADEPPYIIVDTQDGRYFTPLYELMKKKGTSYIRLTDTTKRSDNDSVAWDPFHARSSRWKRSPKWSEYKMNVCVSSNV